MQILCLDLEGVLIPEIWIAVADRTGIGDLRLTTRDVADYDELMQHRLRVLARESLTMHAIQEVIGQLDPLPGAAEFLRWSRERFQVAIISDTFYEFARPLMRKLDDPMLLCHRLHVRSDGVVDGYQIRQPHPKRRAVQAFQSLHYEVIAAGDSYNDIPMLQQANRAAFFSAPPNVLRDYPAIPAAKDYSELQSLIAQFSAELG